MNNFGNCGIFVIMYYLLSAAASYFTVATGDMFNIKMNTPQFRALVPCIASAVAGGGAVLIYFIAGRRKSFCKTCFKKPKMSVFLKLVPVSASVWLCGMALNFVINNIVGYFWDITPVQQLISAPLKSVYIINFVNVCIIVPIFEELFFRGVLFDGGKTGGVQIVAIMSAILFTFAHGSVTVLGLPLVVGIISALILIKTGNIFYCIFVHTLCNGASFVTMLLPQSHKISVFQNLFVLICGAVISAVFLFTNRKKIAVFFKMAFFQVGRYFASGSEIISCTAILLYYIYINYSVHFLQ